MHVRVLLSRYRSYNPCTACGGARLSEAALSYQVAGRSLAAWHALSVAQARAEVEALSPRSPQGRRVREALLSRLGYLEQVGLGYLTLDRQARTLSGGEAQRAGLTTALGAALTGTLFILDEPSVGLHPTDVPKLGSAMQALARAGNTVLLIEHDEPLIRACHRVVELGPGAGKAGGCVLFDGTPAQLAGRSDLPTGRAWQRRAAGPARKTRPWKQAIALRGVTEHNLRDLDVDVPRDVLVAITGPSGSGKSTLVEDVLYRAVARATGELTVEKPGAHRELRGTEGLRRAVLVDQSPLGRTARGNPATYTKAWDRLRARFAAEPEAAAAGLTAAHFSFNVAGGRCEACSGEGYETVEMQFLADVSFLCAVCQGKRFRPEVLAVRHCGVNVAEALALTVDEALRRFSPDEATDPALLRALVPVSRVGLGYLPLGQPLSTLSGGEAQRLKLARALSEPARGALFIVDEPSAGLHAEDVRPVVAALNALVDQGASVVVVEHDLDVVAEADWVIDLGPGGGPDGGRVVAAGTPEQIQKAEGRTAEALRARAERAASPQKAAPSSVQSVPEVAAITVAHAREHNLKELSCEIPHGALTVVTGPSGSGKSSLAFDVVFAEGQRRFMETLTPYARQFLPTLPRPDVDLVAGVPPSIALEQRTTRAGANSTVATVTEAAHYLRLLFAKVGTPHCPVCDAAVLSTTPDALFQSLVGEGKGRSTLYAPAVRARKGTYLDLFTDAARAGLKWARVDGELVAIEPPPRLTKTREHTIDLVVYDGALSALPRELFDKALAWGQGSVRVARGARSAEAPADERILSTRRACSICGTGVPELDPRWFSFNTKQGQCERCEGRGYAEPPEGESDERVSERKPCPACGGTRLNPIPRRVRLFGMTYPELTRHEVARARALVEGWDFSGAAAGASKEQAIAKAPHAELLRRLRFIEQVGLGYLALDRSAATLSGGEMQRLRLSAQLGSGLTGALYVLDEPTIGLHPRDTNKLISNLRVLVDTGSTALVVEHDEALIRAADHLIDLGPGGGRHGGRVMAQGPAPEVLGKAESPTAKVLSEPPLLAQARPPAEHWLSLRGARAHNLKNVDLRLPVGRLTVVAGVSGSGKSTLVQRVFYPALRRALGLVADKPLAFSRLDGTSHVKRALAVDQSPIGRTPRSVPATFLGIWDEIRRLYAGLPESKVRGFSAARFSFNTASGGRCTVCQGGGVLVSEMSFLPDVTAPCEACGGARFEPATLEVRYLGRHIGEVLQLSAEEAVALFRAHPRITRPLSTLCDLGVGYLQLGQGSNTLSGGEAQRLKLAAELVAGAQHEPTVYVLDEPTTGLHLGDARRLVRVLQALIERGDTLVVIEHHPEVIAAADWVVELGPDAGQAGGEIVFNGSPSALLRADTATGRALRERYGEPEPEPEPAPESKPRARSSRTPRNGRAAANP
jgi:excinuclease ABC subunit A